MTNPSNQEVMKMKILLSILMFILPVTLAQADTGLFGVGGNPWKGSQLEYAFTPGQVSELGNRVKLKSKRLSLRVNYKMFHGIVRRDENTAKAGNVDDANDSLINRTFNWVGGGIHTNKGTYFTYFEDTNSDFWRVEVMSENKIRPNLTLVNGFFHYDHKGGNLIESGGRRTTGALIGVQADYKGWGIKAYLETGNNTLDKVEDRFFLSALKRLD